MTGSLDISGSLSTPLEVINNLTASFAMSASYAYVSIICFQFVILMTSSHALNAFISDTASFAVYALTASSADNLL
jgi:hypothetical protein